MIATQRSLMPRMAIVLLALFGFLDSLYLTISRLNSKITLTCVVGTGCETVQSSAWSTLPPGNGIPVAFIGVAGYVLLFVLGVLTLQCDSIQRIAMPNIMLGVASLGIVFSVYLVALQFFVIHDVCFWCMLSAAAEVGIWVSAWLDWHAWQKTNHTPTRGNT